MTNVPLKEFAFELEAGYLCCCMTGRCTDNPSLDAMKETSLQVVSRVREEMATKA